MASYQIKKGKNIKLKGKAEKTLVSLDLPKTVALQPVDFKGLKPRLVVKVDDEVKVGTPLITDKNNPDVKCVSSVSGKVIAINRGEKRVLLEVVVEADGRQEKVVFDNINENEISSLNKGKVVSMLKDGGLWPVIRQRPFSKIANPEDKPKSLFVHAMNTEPLAADIDFVLQGKEKEFQAGLDILAKLVETDVHLCFTANSSSKALTDAQNVQKHQFSGPHPAGNVGTHIHYVDPINKGDIVWFVEAQDVVRIAELFLRGTYPSERIVAVTGEKAPKQNYVKTVIGAPLVDIFQGSDLSGARCLSGSVLTGKNVGAKGFLRFYDSQVTAIPEGGNREFLGWLVPGFGKYTFSKTYASAFLPEREASLDTDENGGHRAIVLNHLYDSYVTLDICTYFLLKAIISQDIEESERLGILECDEEDFSLCTFACPSKVNVSGLIRQGLEVIEKEG
ncbi:MAG: Na(+)-translocating NADH-quinone reductase subunit A [Candidatus Omnitrophica bacterium]|nr:Na(+)-translocating NADH-quinone reductase subunit A [Candidatus Omnitrophota bacterium]